MKFLRLTKVSTRLALREVSPPGWKPGSTSGKDACRYEQTCGWEGHDANLWRKIDPQVFGLYGFAKADAQTTLPTDKVPANIKNIQVLREAYHSLLPRSDRE